MNGPSKGGRQRSPRTLRVRMTTTSVGADGKNCLEAGEEYDLPYAQAQDLLTKPEDMPRAEPVTQRAVETAERR